MKCYVSYMHPGLETRPTPHWIRALVLWTSLVTGCSDITRPIEVDAGETTRVTLTLDVSSSARIATVGIARVRVGVDGADAATPNFTFEIRYGKTPDRLDQKVTLEPNAAPGERRALLLGLEQDTVYHAQAIATSPDGVSRSDVTQFTTGGLVNGLPTITKVVQDEGKLYGGYTIMCTGAGLAQSVAFIIDRNANYVWAHSLDDSPVKMCSRARMSYDGKYMWIGNVNMLTSKGALMRVSMDGLDERIYDLPGRHHDFTMLPNGHVAYFAQANGGGLVGDQKHDVILELDPESGTSVELYSQAADFGELLGTNIGHTNYITYVPELQALSFSMRGISTIGLINYPEGRLITKFGGAQTAFESMDWSVQHGHHVFKDRLIVFSNQEDGNARVLSYAYDPTTYEAQLTLEYRSEEGSITFGEVRELPNGNLFITYSNSGVIHEISAKGDLLRVLRIAPIGYAEHRKSLYGAPPPYDE